MAERTQQKRIKAYFESLHNRHLHKVRKLSVGSRALTVKQLNAVKHLLDKDRKTHLNRVEREFVKRKRRRQLGLQHRRLKRGWMFLNPIRKLIPRRVRVDNHLPDYLFYFCNALIFLFCGINLGVTTALQSLEVVLGQIGVISGTPRDTDIKFPLLLYGRFHGVLNAFLMVMVLVGCNVFEAAVKIGHWVYFFLMLVGILLQAFLGIALMDQNACTEIAARSGEEFSKLVDNYYFSVPAIDEDGRHLYNPDGSKFIVRTYKDSNIMDVFQKFGGCCGSDSFTDYFAKPNPTPLLWKPEVPQSCCTNLWGQNIYCAKEIPADPEELSMKINQEGCKGKVFSICQHSHHMLTYGAINMAILQFTLFLICVMMSVYQLRQIRQLERPTHFNIPGDASNRILTVSDGMKRKRLIEVLSLDPDQLEISDELLETINKIRRGLGLEDLGRKFFEYLAAEQEEIVAEAPHIIQPPRPRPKPYIPPVMNLPKEAVRTRLEIFDLRSLTPYYKGMFSATYEQENKSVKHKVMKDLKKYASKYHTTDHFAAKKNAARTTKPASTVVSRKGKVKANPLRGAKYKAKR